MPIRSYKKGDYIQLTPHFNSKEFKCKCYRPDCLVTFISEELVSALEQIRLNVGALRITSGFRCDRHNEAIGGRTGSRHLLGEAVDLQSPTRTPKEIADAAEPLFQSGGLGRAVTFTHVDRRGWKSRWYY